MVGKIVIILISIVLLCFIGHTSISFKPFSIKMENYFTVIGIILVIVGSILIALDVYRAGHNDGYKECVDYIYENYERNNKSK